MTLKSHQTPKFNRFNEKVCLYIHSLAAFFIPASSSLPFGLREYRSNHDGIFKPAFRVTGATGLRKQTLLCHYCQRNLAQTTYHYKHLRIWKNVLNVRFFDVFKTRRPTFTSITKAMQKNNLWKKFIRNIKNSTSQVTSYLYSY